MLYYPPMYLLIAILGYTLLAGVFILDKLLVSRAGTKTSPSVVAFYSTVPLLALAVLLPFNTTPIIENIDWLLALVSGAGMTFALLSMYKGFASSEVSHSGPLVGAITTLATVAGAYLLLVERLDVRQLAGIALLILGSIVISNEKSIKHNGWHPGMLYAILAGVLFATSNIFVKPLYEHIGFYSGLLWSRFFMGVAGLLFLFSPAVIASFKPKKTNQHDHQPKHFLFFFLADKGIGVVSDVLIQFAIALGSVSIVSALGGLQYGALVVAVSLLSRFRPGAFAEKYLSGEFKTELFGVLIIALGIILVV